MKKAKDPKSSAWVGETAQRMAGLDVTEARTSGAARWQVARQVAADRLGGPSLFLPAGASQTPPGGDGCPEPQDEEGQARKLAVEACRYARTVLQAKPLKFDGVSGLRFIEGRPVQATLPIRVAKISGGRFWGRDGVADGGFGVYFFVMMAERPSPVHVSVSWLVLTVRRLPLQG